MKIMLVSQYNQSKSILDVFLQINGTFFVSNSKQKASFELRLFEADFPLALGCDGRNMKVAILNSFIRAEVCKV